MGVARPPSRPVESERPTDEMMQREVVASATRGWGMSDVLVGDRLLGLLSPAQLRPRRAVRELVESFGALVALVLDAFVLMVRGIVRRTFPWREFFDQAWMLTSVSLLPSLLIAIPFGTVIVLEIGGLASQVGATSLTGAIDATTTVREVAPVVTALVLSGAGGSAICSDLGSRTIRDEISAMEVMGISPVERLVAPRLLAGVLVAVLLNGIVAFAGLTSAYAADIYILHGTAGGYLNAFSSFAQGADILESTLKAAIFGFITAVLASYKGITTKRGAAGVGVAVNQSVVMSGLALFVLDLILTEVFLVIVPPRLP